MIGNLYQSTLVDVTQEDRRVKRPEPFKNKNNVRDTSFKENNNFGYNNNNNNNTNISNNRNINKENNGNNNNNININQVI